MAIAEWLHQLGLAEYQQAFNDNDITLDLLPDLTTEDLKEIGVTSIGHRRQILSAAALLMRGRTIESARPDLGRVGAERRQLTVLFCDLVGSTALSASLDPEEMTAVADRYQRAVAAEIQKIGGYIAEYLGDGIVAYFGYPQARENEPERAVRAGLAMVNAVKKLSGPQGEPLCCRVGIATGLVVVGDLFDSINQQQDNVVGDTPNLAARLQSMAAPNQIVIAPETQRQIGRLFELESLGEKAVKGLKGTVEPWLVTGEAQNEGRFRAMRDVTPIVGRSKEIEQLMTCWQRASQGDPQIALVCGEPGIGKSRLVEEVVKLISDQGHTVHRYFCSPFHTTAAYHPLAMFIERAAGITYGDTQDNRLDKLDALLTSLGIRSDLAGPLLAPVMSLPSGNRYPQLNLAPTALRTATFEALGRLQLAASQGQPLLVVVEDTHWIDPSTREVMEFLAAASVDHPILLLATFRPEDAEAWEPLAARATKIELGRMTVQTCKDVVRNLTGGKKLPHTVQEEILRKADGIPLFVEEITKTLLQSNMLLETETEYAMAVPTTALSIPSTLKDSLMSRLDRVSKVKEIAQIGSVIGRRFTGRMLAAVAGYDEAVLNGALGALVDAEILFQSGTQAEPTYTFKHTLIGDAAYESLLNARRVALHRRIAEVLEAEFPEVLQSDPQLVATHLELAQEYSRAIRYWLRAGQQAMAAAAIVEATQHLGRGLNLVELVKPSEKRDQSECELRTALGLAHISLQGWQAPEVVEQLEPAYELGTRTGQSDNLFMATYGLWIHSLNRANFAESQRWIDRAVAEHGNSGEDDWPLIIPAMRTAQEMWGGSLDNVIAQADEVRRLYDPEKHNRFVYLFGNDPRVVAVGFQSRASWLRGDTERARSEELECERYSEEVDHPFDRCWQLMPGSMVSCLAGDVERFSANVEKALEIGRQQRIPFVQMLLGPSWIGLRHLMIEEWREAIEIISGSIDSWRAMGGGVGLPWWEASLARAHIALGQFDEGLGLLDQATMTAKRTGEAWYGPEIYRIKGEALLAQNASDLAAAEASFRAALAWAKARESHALADRARNSLREHGMVTDLH